LAAVRTLRRVDKQLLELQEITNKEAAMPDGTRKRRFSSNLARRRWYAKHRAMRFFRRFGLTSAVAV